MFKNLSNLAGLFFILFISSVTVLAFYGLIAFNQQGFDLKILQDSYFHSILLFSIKQALLSALLSTLFAWPIARALYYYPQLYLKGTFLSLTLLCFVIPTLVLITGFVSLLGLSGILTPLLPDDWNLYGLKGILLAHVYMNLPFAVRAIYNQMRNIPDSSWRLANQLKLNAWQRFHLLEWPTVKSNLILTFGFITILCFNSFAVVLALGGGPQSTTLEVAIYQALKYDFNLSEALTFAWAQFAIAGIFFVTLYRSSSVSWLSKDTANKQYLPRLSLCNKTLFITLYSLCFLFMLLPLMSLIPGVFSVKYSFALIANISSALGVSIAIAGTCAILAIIISYCIMLPIRYSLFHQHHNTKSILQWLANHTLIAPAMVLSVGLYILFLPLIDLDLWGIVFVVILNLLLILPFAIQQTRARLIQYDKDYLQLALSLKLSYRQRISIEWPYIKPTMLSAFSLVFLIAMGDVAIFSIFGSSEYKTLPWLIYQYAGSYRINEASLASAILLSLYLVVLLKFERAQNNA
jgi:thiamine transport system permease protein